MLCTKHIIRPHIEYCVQTWSPYYVKDIDMVARKYSAPGYKVGIPLV